ncbi:MAG: hypothetical protein K9H61_01815 [Bacteroidia bacterium]|nr:hypothetical protein [Bacteroidia bacterium]MCF8425590.1 hypothetical protein [Bacteroidia bacterium]MCF8445707.1 hypothetical protein [Bacteroidia bacterium]
MKNALLVGIGLLVLVVLVLLSREDYEIPHSVLTIDTIDYTRKAMGPETGGGDPEMGYSPASLKQQPSEAFLGKSFAKCLEMVYEWPMAEVYEINNGHDGIPSLDFNVNNHHHELLFSNNLCVEDNILKN